MNGISSKILSKRNYGNPDELLCDWDCLKDRMNIKYPVNREIVGNEDNGKED